MNALALLAVVISALALVGWITGPTLLTTWIANAIAMKAPTAISTFLQGVSSLLAGRRTITARRVSIILSVIVLGIAHGSLMLRFSKMVIDEGIVQSSLDDLFQVPSVATASALMLLSLAILLYQFRSSRIWPILVSQFAALTIGTSAIAGWLLELPPLYGYTSEYTGGVALPTGICLAALALHGIAIVSRETSPAKA